MSDPLADLLDGRVPAAVYRWPTATRPDHASVTGGWRTFILDGTELRTRETFLDACEQAFHLPHWFGRNWDALWDCLTDLSWAPAPGYLVIYDRWRELAVSDPDSWAIVRRLLDEVSRYWADRQTPFAVLLTGEGPSSDVPVLPATGSD